MSYTPTQWKSGDTVTSAKLNKIESGIKANEVFIIDLNTKTDTLNKTAGEIFTASSEGKVVVLHINEDGYEGYFNNAFSVFTEEQGYTFSFLLAGETANKVGAETFFASGANDYPTTELNY